MTLPESPHKVVSETLGFIDALKAAVAGECITRLEWRNPEEWGCLYGGFLSLRKADGKYYQWLVSEGDLRGEDWIVIE